MKKIILLFMVMLFAQTAFAVTFVKGYYRKDGTYVAPHYRNTNTFKMPKTPTYKTRKRENYSYKPYTPPKTNKYKILNTQRPMYEHRAL